MSIEIQCPSCSKRFRVEDRFGGKRVKCRNCGGAIAVPAGEPDSDLDDLQALAESSAGQASMEEFNPPVPENNSGSGRGGEDELPQGFGAALNAARSRATNRQFSLSAYPGAAVVHQHLPWLIGLVCLGFALYLLIQKVIQSPQPQWPVATMAGTAVVLFLALVIPLTHRGLRRASDMLHFELSAGTLWRTLGLFSLPLLLATMLSDSVPGMVFGVIVGLVMLMPLVWATFQLHWVEAVVAWMMSSLFFAGSAAAVGGVVFFIGLGVALAATPEPPPKVAAKQPPKVMTVVPATQTTQPAEAALPNAPVMVPPTQPTQPEVVAEVSPTAPSAGGEVPSIFGVPSNPPAGTTTHPATEPPTTPGVIPVQNPTPPAATAQVHVMPSPVVTKVTELTWVGEYLSILDTDSLAAPLAVLKRTAEAETIDLLGAEKATAVVSFRKDQTGSDRYVISPGGEVLVRVATWPKPGLQQWTVADNKPGKTTDLDLPEVAAVPLSFIGGDQVLVHRSMGEQSAIQLINVKTGQKVREQRTPTLIDNGYAMSPDGKTLAVATKVQGAGAQLHLIDVATGRTKKLPIPIAPQWPVTPAGVAFSLDSSRVGMVFEQDGNVLAVAWNVANGVKTQEHVYPAGTLPIPARDKYKGRGLDWLADGNTWIVCGSVVIDVASGQAMGSLRISGVTNQRVVDGKKIYVEAAVEGGVKRLVLVDLNADAITKMRSNLAPTK